MIGDNFYPRSYKNNVDDRGNFVEILRSNSLGQYSFSSTKPKVVRGNHYHTRKVERFAVISGEALIKNAKIGTNDIIEYKLSGNFPEFVDIYSNLVYTFNSKYWRRRPIYSFLG